MSRQRIGLWIVIGSLTLVVLSGLVHPIVFGLYRDSSFDARAYLECLGWVELGLEFATLVGLVVSAVTSTAQARRWFAAAVALHALTWVVSRLPWLIQLAGGEISFDASNWMMRAGFSLAIVTTYAIARAAQRAGARDALVRLVTAVVVLSVVLFVVHWIVLHDDDALFERAPLWLSVIATVVGEASALLTIYALLDALGAFADLSEAAVATIATHARTAARAITLVVCMAAIVGVGMALWLVRDVDSEQGRHMLYVGTMMFVATLYALARMRGTIVHPAVTIGITALLLVAGWRALRIEHVPVLEIELVPRTVPGLTIALPNGTDERIFWFHERGRLQIMTRHSEIGLVTIEWTAADVDPLLEYESVRHAGLQTTPFEDQIGDRTIKGVVWSMTNIERLYARWKCAGDPRWFFLEMSRYENDGDVLLPLARRILETVRCEPTPTVTAHKLHIAFTPPTGFARLPRESPIEVFEAGDEVIGFTWTLDLDYSHSATTELAAVLAWLEWPGAGSEQRLLPPVAIESPKGAVETLEREIVELVEGDRRLLVTGWRCFSIGVEILAYYSGPLTEPTERGVKLLTSARCPG